jgi:hypothetical protein
LLAGVFAVAAVGGTPGWLEGNPGQLLFQVYGIAATLAWSGVVTFLPLKAIAFYVPLRVSAQDEVEGPTSPSAAKPCSRAGPGRPRRAGASGATPRHFGACENPRADSSYHLRGMRH